jgi:hypothetical protein
VRGVLPIIAPYVFALACAPLEPLQPDAMTGLVDAAEVADARTDSGLRDLGTRDTGIQPDSGLHDDAEVDAGVLDTGVLDTGDFDAGEVDAGQVDTGEVDAGEVDTGEVDTGEADTGEVDTGEPDAGEPDAGDAGFDAGSCSDVVLTSSVAFCEDFNTGTSTAWIPEAGIWSVVDGAYVGTQTSTAGSTCGETLITSSMFETALARDLTVRIDMLALERADKVLILRGLDPSNRIELNFRAEFSFESTGDLVIQEIETCTVARYTPVHTILVPHAIGQIIHADVTLIGDQIEVTVGGSPVLTSTYSFSDRVGQVGVGVISGGTAAFDNIVIEVLDR